MLTIPMALIGTFGGFYLINMPFSFTAMIGIISLMGIVVNDAIVMVETMNEIAAAGPASKKPPPEAERSGCGPSSARASPPPSG